MITDHIEVTIDDLFVEHYDPPKVPPKISAAMKGRRSTRERRDRIARFVPHPRSLLGGGVIGVAILGAGYLVYKRWFA